MNDQMKTGGNKVSSPAGYGTPITLSKTLTCHNYWCNYRTNEPLSNCPKCGRPLLTSRTFRILGWLLMIPGAMLAIVGALLLILAAPRVVGGMGVKLLVYGAFGLLLLVGLTFAAAGARQASSGRRSQSLMTLVIVLLIMVALIVATGRAFL
jgi:hypothetical protein